MITFTRKLSKADSNSETYRLTIPLEIRRKLDVIKGGSIDINVKDNGDITLTKTPQNHD